MKKLHYGKLIFLLFITYSMNAQVDLEYQKPPAEIVALIDAPQTPSVLISPNKSWMLLLDVPDYPSIAQLSQPELRIAGLRINPRTNNRSRTTAYTGMKLKQMGIDQEMEIKGLPANPLIEYVNWSPDNNFISFTLVQDDGLELWMVDLNTRQARQLSKPILNATMGMPYYWEPGSKSIIAKIIPSNRGVPPLRDNVPTGPIIQENIGKKAPARTYQDLLKNKSDEALFEYYATSRLTRIGLDANQEAIAAPGIFERVSISPDGNYIFVSYIMKPYSYLVPAYYFPISQQILDKKGTLVKELAILPLAEDIPKGFDAVRKGPRACEWRADQAATLCWVEAQDEGDPAMEVEIRDKMYAWEAPFNFEKKEILSFTLRYDNIIWGDAHNAIATQSRWQNRRELVMHIDPSTLKSTILFDRSTEDRYGDPGSFETRRNAAGFNVLLLGKKSTNLFLTGQGASPEGNRPFVDMYDLESKKATRIWQSEAPYYEIPVSIVDAQQQNIITRRESLRDAPNYYLRELTKNKITQLTAFQNPYPLLSGIEKQLIKFTREDGLELQGDLYLPKNYKKEDGPLPVFMWAYPYEFKSAAAASQVQGSPYQFIRLNWGSPIFWVTQGYAVFNNVSMPVVGEGDKEPNDSFVPQIVQNARAAIDKLAEMGVGDRNRVAVGGHSYGAFMTANLLAHCDLFAAGIARSGAYNRSLTPFGFQSEQRTYWEAPEVYNTMSPFQNADKINTPLLMIHGEADNNSGTFPIQSERLFNALKGLGKTTRFVLLPFESHGYAGKESVLHTLWEQHQWLEKYVKNKQSEPKAEAGGK